MRKYTGKTITALRLDRKKGYSIQKLMRLYDMPKTTVWNHVSDIKLNSRQRKILRANQGGSRIRKEQNILKAEGEARRMVEDIDFVRIGPVILAALYWAEGNKRGFVFTNTDERMLQVFLLVLRKFWRVKDEDIQILLRLTDSMDSDRSIAHWSTVTGLHASSIKLDVNPKQNKSKTKYGICRIVIKRGGYGLKLTQALIREMTTQILRVH